MHGKAGVFLRIIPNTWLYPYRFANPDYNGINPMFCQRCAFMTTFAKGGRGDLRRAGCRHTACLARGAREKSPLTLFGKEGDLFTWRRGICAAHSGRYSGIIPNTWFYPYRFAILTTMGSIPCWATVVLFCPLLQRGVGGI